MPTTNTTTSTPRLFALLATASATALACAASDPGARAPTSAPEPPPPASASVEEAAVDASLELGREVHRAAITEVFLDPQGAAAVTIDASGGARLWPRVRQPIAAAPPIVLPLHEAAWISLAGAGDDGRFVVAAIDTVGGGEVGEVVVSATEARWRPLFRLPATDPIYEIHALGGGERLIALGRDHRVRLYDREGRERSVIDVPGLVPWQLRVAQRPGEAPAIVAVLAGPVRVQPIALTDDRLAVVGEAREVALDRGPNRNDLALAPDGAFVTALRRPRAKGRRWSLELIDLASDERRWIGGEVDSEFRPRLHLVEAGRALLESGSGRGFWVDLGAAVLAAPGVVVDRKTLPSTPAAEVVELPGSSEESRMHVALAGGLRAIPAGDALIVDPLAEATHQRLVAAPLRARRVAIDGPGERIVWAAADRLVLDPSGDAGAGELRVIDGLVGAPIAVAFVGDDHLVRIGEGGEATLYRWSDGARVDEVAVKTARGARLASLHPAAGGGGGILGVRQLKPKTPLLELAIVDGAFAGVTAAAAGSAARWPELLAGDPALSAEFGESALADGIYAAVPGAAGSVVAVSGGRGTRPLLARLGGELPASEPLTLRPGSVHFIVAAPVGSKVAIVQSNGGGEVLSVYDLDARERRWSRAFADVGGVAWSASGEVLAVAAGDGLLVDPVSGAIVRARRDLGVEVREERDAPGSANVAAAG